MRVNARPAGRKLADEEELGRVLTLPLALQLPELEARGLPRVGVLILQNSCENSCFFCANAGVTSMPEGAVTGRAEIDEWIDGARGVRVDRICIGGTEPALHPALEHALQRLADIAVGPVEVMTSGIRLSQPGAARRWAQLGVSSVAIPLYGATAPTHDEVVGRPGAFELTLGGIDAARAAGLEIRVHTLALRRTSAELSALSALVRERTGNALAIGPPRPKVDVWNWSVEALTPAELEEATAGVDVTLVGYPACVGEEHGRGAAAVIEIYFRGARRVFGEECARCAARPSCPGVFAAELERGLRLKPRATPSA